jgi:NAD(P)-dependent dehydrogenase (short-subunit alcohol dehydrogenase family)
MRRILLVTGGSRGIGAATARLAASRGYDVAISYASHPAAADAVVADVQRAGGRGLAVKADCGRPDEIGALFATVDRGLGRVDAFFNNAGIIGPAARFTDVPVAQMQRVLAVNTIGAYVAGQEAARRMSRRLGGQGGAIVNMSSMAAKLGGAGESTDYGMSKGAIETLTIGMAKELAGEGVRVNAVRPGLIETEIHGSLGTPDRVAQLQHLIPIGRGGTANEVAEAALWLLSDAASYTTGAILEIGGGRGI